MASEERIQRWGTKRRVAMILSTFYKLDGSARKHVMSNRGGAAGVYEQSGNQIRKKTHQAFFTTALLCVFWTNASADNVTRYQALMARHFLGLHFAIPLLSNGTVKSGELISLPTETRVRPRSDCYNLAPVEYRRLSDEATEEIETVSAMVGLQLPLYALIDVEGKLGGNWNALSSIELEPFSQDQPREGIDVLRYPKDIKECDGVKRYLAGQSTSEVLVTRVFHGKKRIRLSMSAKGFMSGEADIEKRSKEIEAAIGKFLGNDPKIDVHVYGDIVSVTAVESPENMSLGAQAALFNPKELARAYLAVQAKSRAELESLVDRYIYGDDGVFDSMRGAVFAIYKLLGYDPGPHDKYYYRFFSGKGAVPATDDRRQSIPADQVKFAATLGAAEHAIEPR